METVDTAVDVVCDEDDGVVVFSSMVPDDEEEQDKLVEVAILVEDALPMVVVDVAKTVLETIVVEVHGAIDPGDCASLLLPASAVAAGLGNTVRTTRPGHIRLKPFPCKNCAMSELLSTSVIEQEARRSVLRSRRLLTQADEQELVKSGRRQLGICLV